MPKVIRYTFKEEMMKTFYLDRKVDESGVSGTGIVAEGVQFSDGTCVVHWLTRTASVAIYPNIDDLIEVHGHDGNTEIIWE